MKTKGAGESVSCVLTEAHRGHALPPTVLLGLKAVAVALTAAIPETRAVSKGHVKVPLDGILGTRPSVLWLTTHSCSRQGGRQVYILRSQAN